MPDYDLGRARGRIELELDQRGHRRALGALEDLAEAGQQNTKQFRAMSKEAKEYERQIEEAQKAQDKLNRSLEDERAAANRVIDVEEKVNRLRREGKQGTDEYRRSLRDLEEAQIRHQRLAGESVRAEEEFQRELNRSERAVQDYQRLLNDFPRRITTEIDVDTSDANSKLSEFNQRIMAIRNQSAIVKMSFKPEMMALKGGAVGGGIAGAGGILGLLGGGVLDYGIDGIAGIAEAIGQLSGVVGLLPGVIATGASAMGALKIGTQGLGDSFSAVAENDAVAFAQSLNELSKNAQDMMIEINKSASAIEDLKFEIQDAFTQDFAQAFKPLIETYLPMFGSHLKNVASLLNWGVKDLAAWAQQSYVIQDMAGIFKNIETAIGTLAPAARHVADAILDIVSVSSDFMPGLADSIKVIAREFSVWTNEMRESGKMAEWIQTGIDAFKTSISIIKNFGEGLGNVFAIANQHGGGFLGMLDRWAQAFNAWSASPEGMEALNSFFSSMHELGNALTPVLASLGTVLLRDIIPPFAKLGVAMAPGLISFFESLGEGFRILGPSIVQLQGPLNTFLTGLGEAFVETMKVLGPELPHMMQQFVDAFMAIVPHLPAIVDGLIMIFEAVMHNAPAIIEDLGQIIPVVLQFIAVIQSIKSVLVSAATQIVVYLGKIGDAFINFFRNLTQVWPTQAGEWLRGMFGRIWGSIAEGVPGGLRVVMDKFSEWWTNFKATLSGWWNQLGTVMAELVGKFTTFFAELPAKALEAGRALIEDLMRGIKERLGSLGGVAKSIVETITDWLPGSPAKKGPLSGQGWTRRRGESLVSDFAAGMDSEAGTVNKSAGSIAGGADAGLSARTHGWIADMMELVGFGSKVLQVFGQISEQVFNIIDFARTDPATGKKAGASKTWERNVSDAELARKREDKAYSEALDNRFNPKQTGKGKKGSRTASGGTTEGKNQIPLVQNADGTWTSSDPEWAKLIKRESGGQADIVQQIQDANSGGNEASGLFQIAKGTWASNGGTAYAPTAGEATPQQQAEIATRIFLEQGGSPWGSGKGQSGRESEEKLRAGLTGDQPKTSGGVATQVRDQNNNVIAEIPAGTTHATEIRDQTGRVIATVPPNAEPEKPSGEYREGVLQEKGLQPAALALGQEIVKNFPEIQTIGGVRADSMPYHPSGRALDVMIPDYNTPEGKALGDRIKQFAMDNADKFGLEDTIWQDFWEPASGDGGKKLGRAGDTQGHYDHVHITTQEGAEPDLEGLLGPRDADGRITSAADSPSDRKSVDIQEKVLDELRSNNSLLDEQIKIGQDPNATDEQIAQSLQYLTEEQDRQLAANTPESRYLADALGSVQSKIAEDRGFGQKDQDPIDTIQNVASGMFSTAQDILGVINQSLKSLDAGVSITDTLIRGVENTEDIMKIVDNVQEFIELGAKIAGAIGNVASMIGSIAGAGGPMGGQQAASAAQGVAAIAGAVQGAFQTANAVIDLTQEAYRIGTKYLGRFLSQLVGGGQGGLLGDIKFLLDTTDWTLKAWSEDNPDDKRSLNVPTWLQSERQETATPGGRIRDLNLYVGPGTDPSEAINSAMWAVRTDSSGVFAYAGGDY